MRSSVVRTGSRILGLGLFCLLVADCGGNGAPGPATPVIRWPSPAPIIYGAALSAVQLDASANTPGSFAYNPPSGFIPTAGAQTLSVTFTPTDTSDYTTAASSVALTVNQTIPVLSWAAPAAIPFGAALSAAQLNATANIPGVFTYTPSPGTVLSAGAQTLSVTFTPADNLDYATATASVMLTVNQATPVLHWVAPAAVPYSTPLSAVQLDATANVPGAFTYNPSLGSVLTVGTYTLSVSYVPTDSVDFTNTAASVMLTVNQATPRITWAPSVPIALGVPLASAQLDAKAWTPNGSTPVAGTLVYAPPVGTIFNSPLPEALSVTFTPSDSVDYTTAETGITMTVSSFGIAAWGDSLTAGNDGTADQGEYPGELASQIVLPVENLGVAGQTSTEIGVREGGIPVNVTVAGGVIPGTGGASITFPTGYEPVTGGGPAGGVGGTIQGVHGLVTLSAGVYTFTPTLTGSAVNAPGTPKFVVDTPYASYLPVFWEGRNNVSAQPQVLADLAAQVASVPSGQTFLILSVTNDNATSEWSGGAGYNAILALNDQLENLYGANYLDIRKLLVSNYDPNSGVDVSDYQHDEPPTSLRAVVGTATLANSIGPTDTSLTLSNPPVALSMYDILTIDTGANAENVEITAVAGDTVTVERNFGGLNTAHAAGAPVTETDYIHLNAKGYQIVADAVAQFLSAYATQ